MPKAKRFSKRIRTVPAISLAEGAEENGLATMLAELVRQNLEAKPHKISSFCAIRGRIAIVANDVDVALTLEFTGESLVLHHGIVGIPDVTVRGDSDTIIAMSNLPLTAWLQLPLPNPRNEAEMKVMADVSSAMKRGRFAAPGMLLHIPMMLHLTRVMSVNG